MSRTSVTQYFFNNPPKYTKLISILKNYQEHLSERLTMPYVKCICEEVFGNAVTKDPLQLREFIFEHRDEIIQHVNQCQNDVGLPILMEIHKKNIYEKLKLYEAVRKMKISDCNYKKKNIIEIIQQVWSDPPADAFLKVKNCLRMKYVADKKRLTLLNPEMCHGFRIINDELVWVEEDLDKISRNEKFCKQSLTQKVKNSLSWLSLSQNSINKIIIGHALVCIEDIDKISHLRDSFIDGNYDYNILKNFMYNDAYQEFIRKINQKKEMNDYHCDKCKKTKEGESWVQCDSCLSWYHICCVSQSTNLNLSTLQDDDWFCSVRLEQ